MGGTDSPTPTAYEQQLQQEHKQSVDIGHLSSHSSSTHSLTPSSSSTPSLSMDGICSPIQYQPKSKSAVNLKCDINTSTGTLDRSSSSTLSRGYNPNNTLGSPRRVSTESTPPQALKVVLVGDSSVGKTSMLLSYTADKFIDSYSPTIYDKLSTSLAMSGKRIAMTLCDTSGSDDFGHLRPLCYPQADVALICFSTVDSTTLSSVKSKWIKEIRSHCPGVPVILVGTKVDQRENPSLVKELKSSGHKMVSRSEGLRMASQCRAMSYIECSSFTQRNIKAAFDEAITAAMELSNKMRYTAQCAGQCTIL